MLTNKTKQCSKDKTHQAKQNEKRIYDKTKITQNRHNRPNRQNKTEQQTETQQIKVNQNRSIQNGTRAKT